ncbi:MAG: PAS domain S-box protein [Methanoregula sp.]
MKSGESPRKPKKKNATVTGQDLSEALREGEESYHGLFNTIQQAIYIQDHEGRFVEVNDGACAMYGYKREEFIGRTPEFLAAPGLNDFSLINEKIRQALAGEPQQLEFWGRRKNGEIFPKDVHLYKGMYFGKDVLTVVATDITGQKRAEKALHESEEYYRAIINTSPDNITITDLSGTILMGSSAGIAMFGLSDLTEAIGRKITDFIVPEEWERVRQALALIVKTGVAIGGYHGVRKDGSVFPFEAHMSLMRDRRGNPWRLISVVRDISQRKELEDSLSSALARSHSQQQVTADISASPLVTSGEVEDLARMITERAAPLLGVERAGVWIFDEQETRLSCIDLFESTPKKHTSGIILQESEYRNEFEALRSEKFINADNPLTDPRTAGYVEGYLKPLRITSMLDAVVRSSGKNIGLICFEHVEKLHHWEPDECTFACQLADQIALAFTNRERIMAQQTLVESEELFREVFNNANDAVFLHELTPEGPGKYILVNDIALSWLGYTRTELLDMSPRDIVPKETGGRLMPEVTALLVKTGHATFESVHQRKDRSTYPVEVSTHIFPLGKRTVALSIARDITKREKVQDALWESEEKYRLLVETLNEGIWVIDKDALTTYVNPKMAEILGYTAEEMKGRNLCEFMDDERRQICEVNIKRRKRGIKEQHEFEFLKKDGTPIFARLKTSPITGKDGEYLGAIAGVTDITERKRIEGALRESEERLRLAQTSGNIGMWDWIVKTGDLHRSPELEAHYGLSPGTIRTYDDWRQRVHPDDIDTVESDRDAAIACHAPFTPQFRILHSSGEIRWMSVQGKAFYDDAGEVSRVIGISIDITDQKAAEEALRVASAYNRSLLEASPDPLVTISPEGKVTDVNTATERITGLSREALIGTDFSRYFTNPQKASEGYEQVFREGHVRNYPLEIRHTDGHVIPVLYNAAVYRDEQGKIKGVFAAARDITLHKKAEEALRQSEERYRHLFEAVTDYVFTVRVKAGRAVKTLHGPGCKSVTGYSTRDFSRDPGLWLRMVVEEDRATVTTQAEKILAGKEAGAIEHRIVHKDGEVRWVMNTLVPRYDEAGNLIAYDGLIQDITARKQVELALMKSETQLNAIIRASPIPMFVIDDRHQVISWNKALESTTGIAAGEMLGTNLHWKAFYPAERACLADLLLDNTPEKISEMYADKWKKSEIVEGAIEVTDFFPHLGLGGKWLHFMAAPIIDSGGNLIGAVETLEDITRLVMARQDLKESEERYSALFTNNYSVSLLIDPDTGRIIDANDAAVQYYGYSRDQLIAMGIYDLNRLPKDTVIKNLIRAKGQKKKHFFSSHYRADGEKRYVEIYSGPITVQGKPHFYSIIHDITDRRLAEQELKESESRYSALFTNNYSVSLLIDPDTGRIIDANGAAVQYYGYSRDQLTAMGIYDLNRLPKDTVVRNLKQAKGQKEKYFFSSHYRADGEKRYVEIYSGPITVQGKPLFYSIIHDITERKKAEEALRQNEATLNVILQSSPIPKFVIDRNHRVISWNKALEETSGIRARDIVGTTRQWMAFYEKERPCLSDLLVDGATERIPRLYRDKYKKSELVEGAYEVTDFYPRVGKDGKWLHTIAASIIDNDGTVIGAVETLEDITVFTHAQQSLKESEERYRTLVDKLPDYVIVHRDGILLYVNPAAAARMGYDADSLTGKPILPFIAPEYHDTMRQAVSLRMAGKELPSYELKIAAQDGTYRTVLVNGSMIIYRGRPADLNVLTDITTLKQAEETIRDAKEDLEKRVTERTEDLVKANEQLTTEIAARTKAEQEITRSLEEKELLLREIHHRVKNNLQIIASLLNLQSRTITDPNVLDSIKDSQSRVRAMALVHERIYRSHNIAEINLKEYLTFLTKQILQFYNIPQHQIGIMVTMDDILSDIDTIIPVGLILNELVSNSLKHAFPEGRKGTISIECTPQEGNRLRFVYSDNGIGMPAGFDWKTSETLGLRLVNSLVDQLNGTIEGSTGEGTTFIITIQQKQDPAPS